VTTGGGGKPRDGADWDHAFSADDFTPILGSLSLHDDPEGAGEFWVAVGTYQA
jgi:hypothetical protein